MARSSVVIVSPAHADANNGNARTAARWARLIGEKHKVRIVKSWPDERADTDSIMIALHAQKSAASVAAWATARRGRALIVVLTGTDLYPSLQPDAVRSAYAARKLVVLQDQAVFALPADLRHKCTVIYQSTPAHEPVAKRSDRLVAVMVGHLRAVKSPVTLFEAAGLLRDRSDILIDHIGDASADLALGDKAVQTQAECPNYRWLGPLDHAETQQRIREAHVLVHTSLLEGGAHVIMEAVRSGTPVIASRVPGNVGMLGEDYDGYFPAGDAASLAGLLKACREGQGSGDPDRDMLSRLRAQCDARAALFGEETERKRLVHLVDQPNR